jgi:hypothetical protein
MDAKTKRAQLKAIQKAYIAIEGVLSRVSWGQYGREYFALNRAEELQHDRARPAGIRRGLTIAEAAKVFYVRQIIEALQGTLKVEAREYLWIRKSIFFAVALADNYGQELREALTGVDFAEILKVDYVALQEVEGEAAPCAA